MLIGGRFHLAQVNVSKLRVPPDDPRLATFLSVLRRVNRLAESAPGFVWRLPSPGDRLNGADLLGDERMALNISVWESYRVLHDYAYRAEHGRFVRHRREWFERVPLPATALWWIRVGQRPSPADGLARLAYLRANGPSPRAFTVRCRFTAQGARERTLIVRNGL
ncbi:DUF3291 domain-containing protein [Actinokineospora inagensis]|uniref:DUF3291 domain-containing protein n=1 Tax=Actinokineospora inagensis TaxID=103730 RepID=UPI0003F4C12C|nr:DUF3291 domain-containing protein [Actinokineospora inagensis]